MARSRRKTPIISITSAQSEKVDKQFAHRRERRRVRQTLSTDADPLLLPHTRELSDPWAYSKDGKVYVGSDITPHDRRK